MSVIYYLVEVSIGVAIAAQSAVNNQLKSILGGSTFFAALLSFAVSESSLGVVREAFYAAGSAPERQSLAAV
ncbi:DMT family transporter [Escherichia marmotae]|uniref:DMT family transporter n=1 Tax=Escherichia marmotae TaxID=1499973 RepID=A0ABU1C6U5_9ESCH|nr:MULTISPECIES: DMT family transporter [Escherichia]MCE2421484.1 DMT family transporter [Escherichia coli]MCO1156758.1 DMT family transporter [Escherichia coli]MDQ9215213.1 DMT family transporter [Escherichia marmotae]MDQ9230027.1 DMT family transporter [Escherichia marmotae]MDQ9232749.1 DMT family transporter [Escherichia marmotae]